MTVDVHLTAHTHDACCFYFISKLNQIKFSFCAVGIKKSKNNCYKNYHLLIYKSNF